MHLMRDQLVAKVLEAWSPSDIVDQMAHRRVEKEHLGA